MRLACSRKVLCVALGVLLLCQGVAVYLYTSFDGGLISEQVISRFHPYLPNFIKNTQYPFLTLNGDLDLNFFKFKFHYNGTRDQRIKDNMGIYHSVMNQKIGEPKANNLQRKGLETSLANATLFSLVRNSELEEILPLINQIELRFNNKFHYPWSFINDEEFTEEFKTAVQLATKSQVFFEKIPSELWDKPDFIEREKQDLGVKLLKDKGVQYADKESYRNMCRFNSGNFYNTPVMSQFKWYWRIEPKTRYFCDIDYDVFKFMEDNDKTYGFTIALYDNENTVKSLWNTTLDFLKENPYYLHPNGAYNWILEDLTNPDRNKATNGYSTCHFWSNFEIANLDFFRSEPYTKWFEHLDRQGGFYYERFGDAPVHSLGLSLFEDKSKIHWFRDIGYFHFPYNNCPNSDQCGGCKVGQFSPEGDHLDGENCMAAWIEYEMDDSLLHLY